MNGGANLTPGSEFLCVNKIALDIFFPEFVDGDRKYYRAVCLNNGFIRPLCPNNDHSLCVMECPERPRDFYHPWDGKNV